jgi:hypothetical protein
VEEAPAGEMTINGHCHDCNQGGFIGEVTSSRAIFWSRLGPKLSGQQNYNVYASNVNPDRK